MLRCFYLFAFICTSVHASVLEPVTLQLKWVHQFQFAGYYVAKQKGFYRQAGLDVNIIPAQKHQPDEQFKVLSGQAQFGVTHSGLLEQRMQGKPLIALASVFQSSPYCWMVRADSNIYSPKDFQGKKISHLGRTEGAELVLILERAGIDVSQLPIYSGLSPLQDFKAGQFDALLVYVSNEPFKMAQQGIATRQICPKHYGINVYADILFTSEDVYKYRPEMVAKFRSASLRGWRYALANLEEALQITKLYATQKSFEELANEADKLVPFINAPGIPIGNMSLARWQWIAQLYHLDIVAFHEHKNAFLYSEESATDINWSWMLILAVVMSILCVPMYVGLVLQRKSYSLMD
ncbi:ABC transporter substrate-binding protein [Pseudoalteromonas luteoviolacea]|uniref:ABC transporter substrate-binding protein n=1 Tax=Pseudoalteromonas luteoviolacea TaxID=43657 RepID=UPI001B3A338C|nr:ABC transporter substrate-binding protein [Pseudoalteromonas luteoviolacea]MBQ4878526.1 ABC transporter substrate-binding protein [Pseudoalteromonas luteoviolacea]MBQ4907681.1 ABC transporter substrate-binding protein [Pseudoalteromonas luteoviolacea]